MSLPRVWTVLLVSGCGSETILPPPAQTDATSGAGGAAGGQGGCACGGGSDSVGGRGAASVGGGGGAAPGALLWSKHFGGTGDDVVTAVVSDGSNLFLTGHSASPIDFGGGPPAEVGAEDGFTAKLDSSGAHLDSMGFGASAGYVSGSDPLRALSYGAQQE